MSNATLFEFLFQAILVCIGSMALLHEKELARFEKKAAKYIKAFFKALYLSFKERQGKHF